MPEKAQTMGERVATAEEWIKGHEERCEDRYRGIQQSINDMRGTLRGAGRVGIGVVLSLIAWLGVQVWSGVQANRADDRARIAALEHVAPVTVYQTQTPAPAKPAH